ncbi:MAG: hypothetical protein WB493_00220 [Anaeromyxobacteraceae bacterium]
MARRVAFVAALVAVLVDAGWTLALVGARLVDEDGAIYWYAAREFAHLRFREPFFYGQAYHHLGEAFIAAPVVAAGLPPWLILPGVSALIGVATWVVLAALAWRRGASGLAVLLLGAPLVLPVGYGILLQRFFGMGLLLVVLGVWLLDGATSSRRSAAAGFLVTLGVGLVPSSLLPAAAGLAWVAIGGGGVLPWRGLLGGAAAAVAVVGLGKVFHLLDPAWAVHPAPAIHASWNLFASGVRDLPRHLGRVTPRAVFHPGVMLGVVAGVGVAASFRRRWDVAIPAAIASIGTLLALAVDKAHEGTSSVFFAYERMFLGFPVAIGILAVAAAGAWRGWASARAAILCMFAVIAIAGVRWISLPGDVGAELADRRIVLDLGEVEGAVAACAKAEAAARAEGTDLVLYLAHRTLAYTCGALAYGRVGTLYPLYERRTWIIREEADRKREVFVVPDVDAGSVCPVILARVPGSSCGTGTLGVMVVRSTPISAVDLARALGVPVRRY